MAKTKSKRKSEPAEDAAAPCPAGLKRKRADDDAPVRTSKRSAARASIGKLRKIADDEEAFEEEELEVQEEKEARIKEVNLAKMEAQDLIAENELPVVAPGFRLWETESKIMARQGETLQTTKISKSESKFSRILNIQYPELFKLVPLVITQGPYQGRHVFMIQPETGGFRFLDLPTEIRLLVYSFILKGEKPMKITTMKQTNHPRRPLRDALKRRRKKDNNDEDVGIVSLLSINKQIFNEAAPVLYGDNGFSFSDLAELKVFLHTIGSMRRHVRFVNAQQLYHRSTMPSQLFDLRDAVALRRFTIDHRLACDNSDSGYGHYKNSTRNFIYAIGPVLRVLKASPEFTRGVLNIIKVNWKRCETCAKPAPDFPPDDQCNHHPARITYGTGDCKIVCKELTNHCVAIQRDIRKRLAQQLGIKLSNKKKATIEAEEEIDERLLKETEDAEVSSV